ncbi:hypothetical protein PLICRDRAFT_450070 [Plicaturopsis crispa FD-325 SS-3]|uniref:DUF6533 domain-containing protein n=1 Tax=Plicaturopsis crispa FD-325 SS-3 TaxID=944288 RepID=A0A0C9SQ49_PLICR|nr:hypothetical protein PLICRDRAFT_450070 [Plicaturopsis crispa FD-325 SS-3]
MSASEDTVSAARDSLIHDILILIPTTMLYYDHLLTLSDEIAYIWTRPRSLSSILFLLNRWLGFAGNLVAAAVMFGPFPLKVCSQYNLARELLLFVNEVVVSAILGLRVHALYRHNQRVLTLVLVVAILGVGLSGWSLSAQKSKVTQIAPAGCHMANTTISGYYIATPWEMLFVFDCMIFVLTVRATYNSHRQSRGLMLTGSRISLVYLFLRDGTLYFGAMALSNLSNILTFYLSSDLLKGCLATFSSNLSMLLMHKHASSGIMTTTSRCGDTRRTHVMSLERIDRTAPDERQAHGSDDLDNSASGSSVFGAQYAFCLAPGTVLVPQKFEVSFSLGRKFFNADHL